MRRLLTGRTETIYTCGGVSCHVDGVTDVSPASTRPDRGCSVRVVNADSTEANVSPKMIMQCDNLVVGTWSGPQSRRYEGSRESVEIGSAASRYVADAFTNLSRCRSR